MMNTAIDRLLVGAVFLSCILVVMVVGMVTAADKPDQKMLAHDVYFTLKDKSATARNDLVAGCKKYLAGHPGSVWFAAGVIVASHKREVNDRDFDVALHIVFKNKAAHDTYQNAARHHKFIEEYQKNWEAVRVFDSWVDVSSHGDVPEQKK